MNTLIKEAEKREYVLNLENNNSIYKTTIEVNSKLIEVSLNEILNCEKHLRTKNDNKKYRNYWEIPQYDYEPTGNLSLKIENGSCFGVRQTWSDGKKQRVENCLENFFNNLKLLADAMESERIKQEQKQKQREQEARLRKVRERLKQIEDKKIEKIEQEAELWHKAEKIRSYLQALSLRQDLTNDLQIKEWIRWSGLYADSLDPLKLEKYELIREDDEYWEHWW